MRPADPSLDTRSARSVSPATPFPRRLDCPRWSLIDSLQCQFRTLCSRALSLCTSTVQAILALAFVVRRTAPVIEVASGSRLVSA